MMYSTRRPDNSEDFDCLSVSRGSRYGKSNRRGYDFLCVGVNNGGSSTGCAAIGRIRRQGYRARSSNAWVSTPRCTMFVSRAQAPVVKTSTVPWSDCVVNRSERGSSCIEPVTSSMPRVTATWSPRRPRPAAAASPRRSDCKHYSPHSERRRPITEFLILDTCTSARAMPISRCSTPSVCPKPMRRSPSWPLSLHRSVWLGRVQTMAF